MRRHLDEKHPNKRLTLIENPPVENRSMYTSVISHIRETTGTTWPETTEDNFCSFCIYFQQLPAVNDRYLSLMVDKEAFRSLDLPKVACELCHSSGLLLSHCATLASEWVRSALTSSLIAFDVSSLSDNIVATCILPRPDTCCYMYVKLIVQKLAIMVVKEMYQQARTFRH